MIVTQEGDRFYSVSPKTQERSEVPPGLESCLAQDYVVDFQADGCRITYSQEFYIELAKRLDEGMKPREAYESMGFPVNILGRDRANNACRKARQKVYGQACQTVSNNESEKSAEDILKESCGDNQYVKGIHGERIFYDSAFWPAMMEQLEKGASPLQAYEALGFSVEKLGTQRAYKAATHAREWKEKQALPQFHLGDYDGTVPLAEMMSEWGEPTLQTKWEAYLMARVFAMEKREEVLKKKSLTY